MEVLPASRIGATVGYVPSWYSYKLAPIRHYRNFDPRLGFSIGGFLGCDIGRRDLQDPGTQTQKSRVNDPATCRRKAPFMAANSNLGAKVLAFVDFVDLPKQFVSASFP